MFVCRICHEEEFDCSALISPCKCTGSTEWVHRDCLNTWRSYQSVRKSNRCNECRYNYKIKGDVRRTKRILDECPYPAYMGFSLVTLTAQSLMCIAAGLLMYGIKLTLLGTIDLKDTSKDSLILVILLLLGSLMLWELIHVLDQIVAVACVMITVHRAEQHKQERNKIIMKQQILSLKK